MKTLTLKELKELKTELCCKLFYINISSAERIAIRSEYYQVSAELYFLKKRSRNNDHAKTDFNIIPMSVTNQSLLTLHA